MFLIFLQPDLGSTLVFPPIAFSLWYRPHTHQVFHCHICCFVVLIGVLGWDAFRYYQYKSENPRPSELLWLMKTRLSYHSRIINETYSTFIAPGRGSTRRRSQWNRIQALIAVSMVDHGSWEWNASWDICLQRRP